MSTFTYLVTVETERDSGLIASRDEQSEPIAEAIEQGVSDVSIDGIGARSDSNYSVSSVDIVELDKRDLKEVNAAYDAAVVASAPSNAALRAELREARRDAATARQMLAAAEAKLAAIAEEREVKGTRIWQGRDEDRRVYLLDGRYDFVKFQVGDGDANVSIRFDEYNPNDLEVRFNGMSYDMMVLPRSSNELTIRTEQRRR